jgi:hypothetical protein
MLGFRPSRPPKLIVRVRFPSPGTVTRYTVTRYTVTRYTVTRSTRKPQISAQVSPAAALLRRTGAMLGGGRDVLVSWSRRSVRLAVNGRCAAAIVPHDGR